MPSNPLLYEINTRVLFREMAQVCGQAVTFATVPKEYWQRLRDIGADIVWLMGIWKPSLKGQEMARRMLELRPDYERGLPGWTADDVVGSPYAIADYSPNPRLGSWEDLDKLREQLHSLNIQLILDFVPNHTALDHPWIHDHVEYYIQDYTLHQPPATLSFFQSDNTKSWIAHGRDPHYPAWTDTAQLNYFSPQTRTALMDTLTNIAQHCDGVRCDMAMLELNAIFEHTWKDQLNVSQHKKPDQEFWQLAICTLKLSQPEFLWIAEAYWGTEPVLQDLGFDYTYDKSLYDVLKQKTAREVKQYIVAQVSQASKPLKTPSPNKWVRFVENHDELRASTALGKEPSLMAAMMTMSLPGLRLLHEGQEKGWQYKLPVQLGRRVMEANDPVITPFYSQLLAVLKQPVFHEGAWQWLEPRSAGVGDISFDNIVAYQWQLDQLQKLVVINFSVYPSHAYLKLPNPFFHNETLMFYDELNNKGYRYSAKDILQLGLYIDLAPWSGHVFDVRQ